MEPLLQTVLKSGASQEEGIGTIRLGLLPEWSLKYWRGREKVAWWEKEWGWLEAQSGKIRGEKDLQEGLVNRTGLSHQCLGLVEYIHC